ncbi:DNA-binding PadR family transcriptional regulator [Paenibacillus sp. DS2015]|uniref:PadR family transcriptional regulator n=1 Tax=Paenibacillus sp. DS2015 TaxID=3373917 RepID=UPI003D1DB50D
MQDKIILGLLLDGDKSSYDIKKNMEMSTGFFYNSSQGSIQPALKKLLQNGHVTFSEEYQGARVKKVYAITKEGEKEFIEWADEEISLEKPRDPALVKIFFSNYVELDRQLEMIEEYLHEIKNVIAIMRRMEQISLEQIKNSEQALENGKIKSRMATLQFGMDYYIFLNEWYEKYLRQLRNDN